MRSHNLKATLKAATRVMGLLLFGAVASFAQQQINMTAGPSNAILPDGSTIPMWGYSCGAVVAGSTATCAALNPAAGSTGWSPVVITIPSGQSLTINLTNNLTFTPTGGTPNNIPTSLMIVGQLGGGLGNTATTTPSPVHSSQEVTWSTLGTSTAFTPPPQGPRVQSFLTEVATGTTTPLTWTTPKPGTYLIESGTHPSIQGTMGLYGILVVTCAPGGPACGATAPGTAYPGVAYAADVPLLLSEIDPVQNKSVNAAVNTAGFSEMMVWSGQPGGCGNPSSATYQQCYPAAVNYTPLYYTINGVAFNKTNVAGSLFNVSPNTGVTGNVLIRFVNAGSRMHVPSIVGSQTTGESATGAPTTVGGFALIAEDGNPLPGIHRVQSDVFMAAGKTYDVMIKASCVPVAPATACTNSSLPVYDRELSLSGNAISRDAGMLAYIGINGASLPSTGAFATAAKANNDVYNSLIAGQTLTVSDPSKGVIANDVNVYGVQLLTNPVSGATVTLKSNGTFTYVPTGSVTTDSFTYCANGTVTAGVCSSGITATVNLGAATIEAGSSIVLQPLSYTANTSTYIAIKTPGVLLGAKDSGGYPLQVATSTVAPVSGLNVVPDANGGFTATAPSAGVYTFTYQAKNSQGTLSAPATVTITFPTPSNLTVTVLDGYDKTTQIKDYRWIIEEDRTFYIDPKCATNPPAAGCPTANNGIVPSLGVNFHTSYMPFVAQGCTGVLSCEGGQTIVQPDGTHATAVCDVGNGACRPDPAGNGFTAVMPSQVHLDPTKRYYISILPGDAATPFISSFTKSPANCSTTGATNTPGNSTTCGHGMGGAPISAGQTAVTILSQPTPNPPGKLSVFVFEDDFPLNGEQDAGGGVDVLSPNEPGLGGFQIHLWDAMGGNGDFTGQMTYDMFNQPLTNSLAGTKDPATGMDACPISSNPLSATTGSNQTALSTDPAASGMTGMIVTCPKYEADGKTLSPLAGQAVIANLMPGRWGAIATPGADRIARGEEWLQTNTLDGQKAHDVFTRIGEPSYFQEFGPAGYHVTIGFANPAIINSRHASVCNGTNPNITGTNCTNTVTGRVVGERLSRNPDERLYGSGSHDAFYWTQCFVSFGDPDGEDFAFTKCDANGNFALSGLPDGDWRITTFDQWNDQLVDGLSTPIRLDHTNPNTGKIGDIAATQWQTNLYTRTFIDDNKDGASQSTEAGIPFANVAVRLRDGSLENLLQTDFTGTANFNETFPLFAWYTVETDTTRYKNTGTHVVYDAGGPADGTLTTCGGAVTGTGYPPCGNSVIGKYLANTVEKISVPTNLRVPGAVYCAAADCTNKSIQKGPGTSDPPSACTTSTSGATAGTTTCSTTLSTGRIDPPFVGVEGWQGFPGQNNFIEFGKEPYAAGENGGIKGHVIYASTRPFDDPQMLVQTQWEPLVPHVTINLYQEGFAADGVTPTLRLVDTTQTSSFDDYAQGFRPDGTPNMSCPGQGASTGAEPDLFFYSLFNQPNYLDLYNANHNGGTLHSIPNNSQFKCYDGMHNWNQIQPAPYDGMYQFPSITSIDPVTGKPNTTNCTICSANTAVPSTDLYYGLPMLPRGKYVVEVVVPPGFELVKEEDKNILIGDNYIAPVTQEFGGLGNVFILPDQASVASAYPGTGYNPNNPQNPTQSLGTTPQNGIVPGFVPEPLWPCVGEARIVPDYISLFPQSKQISPFAGATRNLCDRKEVTLGDQMGAIAKFYIYTSTHTASKFTGGITDDYTSEFDPFSPQFGEKFAPPDLPVSIKDWTGNEISRVYADHWGSYDGMTYSTWEVNPPNPTGYSPTMMVFCMNDPGPITGPSGALMQDPAFTEGYSQFCYELPFMPGTTQYLDTPVVPTSAFAGAGYNNADCSYPDSTPAVSEVDGDAIGPWVNSFGNQLTITSLGNQTVPNYAYSGPSATAPPYNQRTITRHYGFGTTKGTVTIGGIPVPPANITTWNDMSINLQVPSGVPVCPVQQQAQYFGTTAYCGQLVITRGDNGRQSIDTVTVTIGGKAPTHINASDSIQSAIDKAAPGDLLIVDPTCTSSTGAVPCTTPGTFPTSNAAHNELLLMWKPVRLQGVGAASSIINATTHPAGKLDSWRANVNCLFGLALNGTPLTPANPFDPSAAASCPGNGWNYFSPTSVNPQVDRLPEEAGLGWDAGLNGNLAELLQEPSLMGALEGAGITVLSKGVNFPSNPWDPSLNAVFPAGTLLLQNVPGTAAVDHCSDNPNPFPSNFMCNPSSIDGLTITDSSQGGGGIYVHGWGHNIQIANNRIKNNSGTLSGGINVGQGEHAASNVAGATAANAPPGTCQPSAIANALEPYCYDINVNMHNNYIAGNSSTGDELFSATPAGAGGVSICNGSDYYLFSYNWVCGNMSSGDGGGFGHIGLSYNGTIEHNSILFNQSINPTIPANGGGILVMGAPDADPICGTTTDADCVSPPNVLSPSDGAGPGLLINANLIMGNAAESGSGGGIRLQNVNGSDVVSFPADTTQWHHITIQNNIIANNVAGWDGAGISLLDALNVDIVNNTIASNSSTASAGILFTTIGAPLASASGNNCTQNGATTSCPQVSGLVSIQNSAILSANMPPTVTCPPGHFAPGSSATNGACRSESYPLLLNNILWQNSSYYIGTGALSPQFQQHVVSLYNAFTTTAAPTQPQADGSTAHGAGFTISGGTGACVAASYWDIGVRGDTGPANHNGGITLAPAYSLITNTSGYTGGGLNNVTGNPNFISQYCDGSRTPPEFGASGWAVPAGIADANVPNPIFSLTPVATVDEGNNWINMRWGPLSMANPVTNTVLGNYSPAFSGAGSNPVIGAIPSTVPHPKTDFFGNVRPDAANVASFDIGAVEYAPGPPMPVAVVTGGPLSFGNVANGTTSAAQILTLHNNGTAALNGIAITLAVPFTQPAGAAGGTCTATLGAGATCTINVVFSPTVVGQVNASLTITATNAGIAGSPVIIGGTGTIPTPVISTTSLPNGTQKVAYTTTLVATSGTLPYTWSVASGTLPVGLTLAPATGVISGTPTGTGTSNFTVQVTDAGAKTATALLSITINAGAGGGAIALMQQTSASGSGVSTVSATFINANTAGNLILAFVRMSTTSQTVTITDIAGNTYTQAATQAQTTDGHKIYLFYARNIAISASNTVRATFSGTNNHPFLAIYEYSGLSTIAPLDRTRTAPGFGAAPSSGATATTTSANELVFAGFGFPFNFGGTRAPGAGFAILQQNAGSSAAANEAETVNITGAYTGSMTISSPQNWSALVATFVGTGTAAANGPTVTNTSLAGATKNVAYGASLVASGGTAPYTWSISSGTLPAGLTLTPATGGISGTPTTTGTSNFTVQVTDATSQTGTQPLSITVVGVNIATTTLTNAVQNTAYTATLVATGGTAPYSWTVATGALPVGLTLDPSLGAITGTPTASGTFNLTVQATDLNGLFATQALSLTVLVPPTITTTSLPNATQNTAYTTTLAATSGTTPYTWSVTIGTLPVGLTLNAATGVISGSPTTPGTSNFTVQVKDANALTATQALSLTVVVPPPSVSTTNLPNATLNAPYTAALAVTGGTAPYTWSITVGTLPTGLALNASTGAITGTPTASGTINFTVQVQDASALTAAKALSITVFVPPTITTITLPNATQNTAYTTTLAATNGTTPYAWSVTVGTPPAGLTLNAATGVISGTPTATGTTNFTVQVKDANAQTATQALSLTVLVPPPSLTTSTLPNATVNVPYNAALGATGGTPPYTWAITVGSLPTGLNLNAATGAITGTPTVTGTVNFTVQVTDSASVTAVKALSITVLVPPPTITTASFPNAQENVAYNTGLAATGGTPAYTWAITVGSLPTGLTLNTATGAITGTATVLGTSNFTAQVTDSTSVAVSKALSITVAGPTITTTSLPNGTMSVAYNTTVVATGGTTPYAWSLSAGNLAAEGLSLNAASGVISGTPNVAGPINITVRVTDANSATTTMALTITINAAKAFVQAANNFSAAAGQTSNTVNIATTAGHLLVAFVREGSNATDNFTISDSGANTWTQAASGYVSAGSSHRAAMFYSFAANADTSVTAHFTTAGGVSPTTITVMEFSGYTAADGAVNSSNASASNLTSGSLTTTSSDVLIYAVGAGTNQTSWTAGTGFAIPANGSNARSGMQYRIVAAPFSGTTSISETPGGGSMVGVFAGFR